jgi:hypothetical protein
MKGVYEITWTIPNFGSGQTPDGGTTWPTGGMSLLQYIAPNNQAAAIVSASVTCQDDTGPQILIALFRAISPGQGGATPAANPTEFVSLAMQGSASGGPFNSEPGGGSIIFEEGAPALAGWTYPPTSVEGATIPPGGSVAISMTVQPSTPFNAIVRLCVREIG